MDTRIFTQETTASGVQPLPIVRSYARQTEFLTLNLDMQPCEPDGEAQDASADDAGQKSVLYSGVTVSVSHRGRMDAAGILSLLYAQGLYPRIDTRFLKDLSLTFGITDYRQLAALLIGGRYSYAEELAAHRKALSGDTADIEELTRFADECKAMARPVFTSNE
ncbi:MAG: hypothetical protein MR534_04190 [Prevotellaceae bacterium]|nr:hypothetical protein [Prevotellaceae bacterium]